MTAAVCKAQLNMTFKSHAVAADLQTKRSSHSVVDNIHVEQLNKCQLQGLAIRWGLRANLLCMFAACGVGCRGAVHKALHVTAAPAEQRCCILLNLGLPERCFAKTCTNTALFQCCRHGRVHLLHSLSVCTSLSTGHRMLQRQIELH